MGDSGLKNKYSGESEGNPISQMKCNNITSKSIRQLFGIQATFFFFFETKQNKKQCWLGPQVSSHQAKRLQKIKTKKTWPNEFKCVN